MAKDRYSELAGRIEGLVSWQLALDGGALKGPPASHACIKSDA